MTIKHEDLQYGHYYVCDVALSPATPIVRVVLSEGQPGDVIVLLTGPGFQGRVDLRTLAHLEILEEIKAMDPKHNTNKMPEPPKPPGEPETEPEAKSEPAETEAR